MHSVLFQSAQRSYDVAVTPFPFWESDLLERKKRWISSHAWVNIKQALGTQLERAHDAVNWRHGTEPTGRTLNVRAGIPAQAVISRHEPSKAVLNGPAQLVDAADTAHHPANDDVEWVRSILPRPPAGKLAYLLSEYPLLEHAYLLAEVRQLRELGWNIQAISIRRPAVRSATLSADEQEEHRSTWYVLGGGIFPHIKSHAISFATHPARYLRGLATAWRLGGLNLPRLLRATAYFCEAINIGRRLREADIRYVHSVYATTPALILSRVFDINLSMTLHGSAEFVDPIGFGLREKVAAAQLVCSISYFGKSQIMLSSCGADWYKLRVTPLGVDILKWRPRRFREYPAPFQLISVGRLVETKGCPLLLEAIAQLRHKGRDIRLTLVGDGPLRASLEMQARQLGIYDRVNFAGWKAQDELRVFCSDSDLCVLASFAEGVPVVLMEAMAAGIPCVAPRIAGIPELIRDGIDGILVTPANVKELVDAIAQLMDEPELRRSMARSSRERITDNYDLLKNTLHLSEIFRQWMASETAATTTHTKAAFCENAAP
jgi:glycosyltransferase involved in cell wall biosynthesis